MLYETECHFNVDDVEDWMWDRATTRAGYWTIIIPLRTRRKNLLNYLPGWQHEEEVIFKRVNFSQKEFAQMDKVVTNQVYSESKAKVYRAIVYQRSLQLWDSGNEDDVTMRTLGAWAMAHYKCQANKFHVYPSPNFGKNTLALSSLGMGAMLFKCPRTFCRAGTKALMTSFGGQKRAMCTLALGSGLIATCILLPMRECKHRTRLVKLGNLDAISQVGDAKNSPADNDDSSPKSERNSLGYQSEGAEYVNEHEGGGVDADDSEIRATVQGRIVKKNCGVGVVGQSTDDNNRKQICGVLSQPISVEPNVYAQELLNAIKAIEERINKKQRPYAGTEEDKRKIGRMVSHSMHGKRHAPFSTKKIMDTIHSIVLEEIKSNKWTEQRVTLAVEKLCREIDPKFSLKASVKLEPMPEGKAPRLLIADEDVGQVMALMTIYVIETLIKKHFPAKGIKGLAKKEAIKRMMKACRVPRKVAKNLVTVFEGDGSAWDTTCSLSIRDMVENPVINHVANYINAFLHATPDSWANAHATICAEEKLDLSYAKNKEFQKIVIDSIRRSGHRGTSCLNWWMNFVCWHCAVFENPEEFLDPEHRYGKDVSGVTRWLNSCFEGDDSFLVTSPKILPGKQLHTMILQFWERIGFNMKIELRDKRALFVGYYIGLDEAGPCFNEERDEWMMVPEIDRCFSRAGTSCSPSMIQAFNADQIGRCVELAGAAAMSRAYEFSGLCPTISEKFLQYANECGFTMTYDLQMRTNIQFADESELVEHIRAVNATCAIEDKILTATGFWLSNEERAKFQDYAWHYTQLEDWKGFKNSLPASWRP